MQHADLGSCPANELFIDDNTVESNDNCGLSTTSSYQTTSGDPLPCGRGNDHFCIYNNEYCGILTSVSYWTFLRVATANQIILHVKGRDRRPTSRAVVGVRLLGD